MGEQRLKITGISIKKRLGLACFLVLTAGLLLLSNRLFKTVAVAHPAPQTASMHGGKGQMVSSNFTFPTIIPDENPLKILGPAGELFTFVKTGATTCGSYVMAEAVIPPGAGPLPHIHHYTNEWFYFPDGGIVMEHGSHQFPDIKVVPGEQAPKETLHLVKTKPGDLYYGARYYVHGFFNESDKPKRLIFIWTPDDDKVGITAYFKAVGQHFTDPKQLPLSSPLSKLLFVSEAPKYGINQSSDFWQYVGGLDFDFPKMDSHTEELKKLLAPDVRGGAGRQCRVSR
jgi:mannose-6-phosphate isomerase-like protein (cupin superfamily)